MVADVPGHSAADAKRLPGPDYIAKLASNQISFGTSLRAVAAAIQVHVIGNGDPDGAATSPRDGLPRSVG